MASYSKRDERFRTDARPLRVTEAATESEGSLEVVVPYMNSEGTGRVLKRAAALTEGLNAKLKVIAVYIAPYPSELRCPTAMEEHLTARLTELAEQTSLPASVHLLVARDWEAALREALRPHSVILLGSRKSFWRTREEKLAQRLARQGHHVSFIHFD